VVLELLCATLELLGATLELLGVTLELLGVTLELLCATLELLGALLLEEGVSPSQEPSTIVPKAEQKSSPTSIRRLHLFSPAGVCHKQYLTSEFLGISSYFGISSKSLVHEIKTSTAAITLNFIVNNVVCILNPGLKWFEIIYDCHLLNN
jgi:hypothetical protein